MRIRNLALVAAAAFGCIASLPFGSGIALADPAPTFIGMTPQDVGVLDRPRPEYDALGIPFGGFTLFPTLDAGAAYDDNVLRLPTATSDYFFTVAPALRLSSNWGRHFFEVYGGLQNYTYVKLTGENLTDWKVGSDGRYDISRAATFTANAFYGEFHEPLSSENTVGFQKSPNRDYQTHADALAKYQPNRLAFSLSGSFDRYNWQNTPLIGGGFLANNDRDEDEYQGSARIGYDFSPGYSGFLKGTYDDRVFDLFFDRNGIHRNSHGYRLDGGLDFQITHLVTGEVYIGYLDQRYTKNQPIPLHDVSGLDYSAQLDWFATPVLTVHLNGSRQVSDTILPGVSASDDKTVKLSAEYEVRRNIIASAYASYTNSTLTGSSRVDNYPGAGVGVKYLINRYVSADFHYDYSERSSNFPGVHYNDNTVSVGLSLHI